VSNDDLNIVGIENPFTISPINLPYGEIIENPQAYPVVMVLPNQKVTCNWDQTTENGEKSNSGEYRIKIKYNYDYSISEVFTIL
jgi:hypothetical protein